MSTSIHTPSDPNSSRVSEQARETAQKVANNAMDVGQDAARHFVQEPAQDLFALAKSYAKEKPDVAACWAFGLGVVVGWKLRG